MYKLFFFLWLLLTLPLPAMAASFHSHLLAPSVRADNIELFPKWTKVIGRTKEDFKKLDTACQTSKPYAPCHLGEWQAFLTSLKGQTLQKQIKAVNHFINESPYIEDIVNWGVSDYWETPREFQKKSGDCEDFSIAKFLSLRALGVDEGILRIAIVKDLNLGGIIHAIVLVNANGELYVMDNQVNDVIKAKKVFHYLPLYAINGSHWWHYLAL